MRTLLISDLHLGSRSGSDVLRRPELRAPLLETLEGVERLVLLGDVLELRHGPAREALAAARVVFEDLGRVLEGRELVIVAGNHDHALVEPWLAGRGEQDSPAPLGLEQLLEPAEVSPMLERIAQWASPALVRVAYPGLWLRSDVYATHGHYLDCHLTVPTLERLSVAAMCRLLGRRAADFTTVSDYESVTAPVFAWRHAVARDARTGSALNGLATLRAWRALGGGSDTDGQNSTPPGAAERMRALRRRALVAAFPLAVTALNRAGFGPLRSEISGSELRRAGLRAMGEVAAHLGLGDAYVIFGHTHRVGPLPGDDLSEWHGRQQGTSLPGQDARLVNAGCWTYERIFLRSDAEQSPYWPGACAVVEDEGAPAIKRLLQDRTHAELAPAVAAPIARP
jgi:hypothetical protein